MHPNADLIDSFYRAFARRDFATMARAYHPEAHFTDEVFDLRGDDVGMMWRMLCTKGADLVVSHGDVQADDAAGSARWEAQYTFSATGRKVTNRIEARFAFRDGRIVRHEDRFDFWRWSRQALGPTGLFLGWTGAIRARVQKTAAKNLASFAASVARESSATDR